MGWGWCWWDKGRASNCEFSENWSWTHFQHNSTLGRYWVVSMKKNTWSSNVIKERNRSTFESHLDPTKYWKYQDKPVKENWKHFSNLLHTKIFDWLKNIHLSFSIILDIKKKNFHLKKHLECKCARVHFEQIWCNLKDMLNNRKSFVICDTILKISDAKFLKATQKFDAEYWDLPMRSGKLE